MHCNSTKKSEKSGRGKYTAIDSEEESPKRVANPKQGANPKGGTASKRSASSKQGQSQQCTATDKTPLLANLEEKSYDTTGGGHTDKLLTSDQGVTCERSRDKETKARNMSAESINDHAASRKEHGDSSSGLLETKGYGTDCTTRSRSCEPLASGDNKTTEIKRCHSSHSGQRSQPEYETCVRGQEDIQNKTETLAKELDTVSIHSLTADERESELKDTFMEESPGIVLDIAERLGAKPKQVRKTLSEQLLSVTNPPPKLDIVRKMSEPTKLPENLALDGWQVIGNYFSLKQKVCQRLFAESGRSDDLALFYHNGMFYAMEAWCSHMGGPLFDGDIEDYNGRCHVMCPWHSYMFDLQTGKNEIGLQQKVYDMKLEKGNLYVKYHTRLTLDSKNRKISETAAAVINFPPKGGKVESNKERKTSVLESPIRL